MPTTTNYGWTTPADTDLVKDGASAIRTLGTAIDTTVFNNASAGIAKTIVDAKGDLIVATAADTVARLASSASNGDLLTVDTSTASGLKWAAPAAAGGMTLITTTTFNDTASTYTYSSLGSYKHLLIVAQGLQNGVASLDGVGLQYNSDTTTSYNSAGFGYNAGSTDSFNQYSTNIQLFRRNVVSSAQTTNNLGEGSAWIFDYTGSGYKSTYSQSYSESNRTYFLNSTWNNTAAITSLTIFTTGGNNFKAGILKLYGVS